MFSDQFRLNKFLDYAAVENSKDNAIMLARKEIDEVLSLTACDKPQSKKRSKEYILELKAFIHYLETGYMPNGFSAEVVDAFRTTAKTMKGLSSDFLR